MAQRAASLHRSEAVQTGLAAALASIPRGAVLAESVRPTWAIPAWLAAAPANAFVGRKEPMLDETRVLLGAFYAPWDRELEAMLRAGA